MNSASIKMPTPKSASDFVPHFVYEVAHPNNIWLVIGKTDRGGNAKAMYASGNSIYRPFVYSGTIIMEYYRPLERVRIMIN